MVTYKSMLFILTSFLVLHTDVSLSAESTTTAFAEISLGELIDKITILQIKSERISDPHKLHNVNTELGVLQSTLLKTIPLTEEILKLIYQLKQVNEKLWDIENATRDKERLATYDEEFIQLARSVYINNGKRHALKAMINKLLGSRLVEEKQYTNFDSNAETAH